MLGLLCAVLVVPATAAVISHAAGIDKQATPKCTPMWFMQPVDHFGKNNATFQQKYTIDATYFKPGGPIFFNPGGEGASLECTVGQNPPVKLLAQPLTCPGPLYLPIMGQADARPDGHTRASILWREQASWRNRPVDTTRGVSVLDSRECHRRRSLLRRELEEEHHWRPREQGDHR